jgi:hypothetical protein
LKKYFIYGFIWSYTKIISMGGKMNKFLLILLFLTIFYPLSADINSLKFIREEFAEDSYEIRFSSTHMDFIENEQLNSQTYDYAFRSKSGDFEIRYILFKQTEQIPQFEQYKIEASIFATMVIANITGSEPTSQNTTAFNDADVKNEFNADFGITSFSLDIQTDYSFDYEYVMINFYCKQNLGIMCQTIHFKDLEWVNTEDFMIWFHGFNFY